MKRLMASRGATLAEYALIGALILAVAIGAVMLTGGGLRKSLLGVRANLSQNIAAAKIANAAASIKGGIGGVVPSPKAGQQQICYTSGWCINLPIINSGVLAQTTGGLGGSLTSQFADVFLQIAKQLDASGTDPTLAGLMTEMANQGHVVGSGEGNVDGFIMRAAETHGNLSQDDWNFLQNYYPTTLADAQAAQVKMNTLAQRINAYLQANPNALPPEMKDVMQLQLNQINSIQKIYNTDYNAYIQELHQAGYSQQEAELYGWLHYAHDVAYLDQGNGPGSALTHQSANTVCGSGGNKARCVH